MQTRLKTQIASLVVSLAACGLEEPESLETLEAESIVLGQVQIAGQTLTVTEMDGIPFDTVYIAACGKGVLYSTRTDGSLWFNRTQGVGAWTRVTAGAPGQKIACDRRHLFSLSGSTLRHAGLQMNGQLDTSWSTSSSNIFGVTETLRVPAGTDQIASGNGNIYALVFNETTQVGSLYSSQLDETTSPTDHVQGSDWTLLANNLGSDRATGSGSKAWFNAFTNPGGLTHVKRNRAFVANPDDRLFFNDSILYGQNWWTEFQNPGLNIQQITADSSSVMFALVSGGEGGGFGKRIVRFSFAESNCTDNLDNDANGLTDAEDATCRGRLAADYCESRSFGHYCIDRIENTDGYDHALVTCEGDGEYRVEPGLCVHNPSGIIGSDYLRATPTNPEPYNSGRYCSVIYADGRSGFSWTGDDPCEDLLDGHHQAFIARAGLYAKSGVNNVHVTCANDESLVVDEGVGTAPLSAAKNAVSTLLRNRCVFTVSPKQMPVFNAPFPTLTWTPPTRMPDGTLAHTYGRGYSVGHVFDHAPQCVANDPGCPCVGTDCSVPLGPFGNGSINNSAFLDNRGIGLTSGFRNQNSYDYVMAEGVPLRSLGYGRVLVNGSRDRDVSGGDSFGTPSQGEIYIRYDVGSDPRYQETFIAYYGHVGQRVVVSDQTVEPGQLIGFVGTTGSSSNPHLHFGVVRVSNTNQMSEEDGGEAFGYRVPFATQTSAQDATGFTSVAMAGMVDPYGWRAPMTSTGEEAQDPNGHYWRFAATGRSDNRGIGAWSPNLWRGGEIPPYPELPPN